MNIKELKDGYKKTSYNNYIEYLLSVLKTQKNNLSFLECNSEKTKIYDASILKDKLEKTKANINLLEKEINKENKGVFRYE